MEVEDVRVGDTKVKVEVDTRVEVKVVMDAEVVDTEEAAMMAVDTKLEVVVVSITEVDSVVVEMVTQGGGGGGGGGGGYGGSKSCEGYKGGGDMDMVENGRRSKSPKWRLIYLVLCEQNSFLYS